MAEEQNKVPRWIPLYVSLVIIMIVFFIMLVAYSTLDKKREKTAIGSVRETFGISGGMGLWLGLFPTDEGSSPTDDPRKEAQPVKSNSMVKKLHAFGRFCESHKGIRVRYDSKGMRIDAAKSVVFDLGSAKLTAGSEEFLRLVADLVIEGQGHAFVEGHCDKADIEVSEYGSGWELTIKRAIAVTRFFINSGVEPDRLASYGYSEFNPLSQGENKKDDFNRSVTILIDMGKTGSSLGEFEDKNGEKEAASSSS